MPMDPKPTADRTARSAASGAARRPHGRNAGRTREPVLDADACPYDSFLASFHKRGARREGPCRQKQRPLPSPTSGGPTPMPASCWASYITKQELACATSVMWHIGRDPAGPSSCWIRSLSLTIDQRAQEHPGPHPLSIPLSGLGIGRAEAGHRQQLAGGGELSIPLSGLGIGRDLAFNLGNYIYQFFQSRCPGWG